MDCNTCEGSPLYSCGQRTMTSVDSLPLEGENGRKIISPHLYSDAKNA